MTTTERIKKAFDQYLELPLDGWKSFTDMGEILLVEKDIIIKQCNTIENYLYFILSGSGAILIWNKQNAVCIDLCYENDFFGDYMSFLTHSVSPLEVVTFERTELFRISKSNFDKLSTTQLGDKICRFAAEGLFIHKQQQQIDILTKTAKERYMEIQQQYASMLQRTPQKHIASYLGITPQSLSRIRSELAK